MRKPRQVYLTDDGHENAEALLAEAGLLPEGTGLYDFSNVGLVHHLIAALRAKSLFQRDVDYIVHEGQIVIVDEFTRSHATWAPLVGWSAPGSRSERRRTGSAGKSDACFDHFSELLQALRPLGRG